MQGTKGAKKEKREKEEKNSKKPILFFQSPLINFPTGTQCPNDASKKHLFCKTNYEKVVFLLDAVVPSLVFSFSLVITLHRVRVMYDGCFVVVKQPRTLSIPVAGNESNIVQRLSHVVQTAPRTQITAQKTAHPCKL